MWEDPCRAISCLPPAPPRSVTLGRGELDLLERLSYAGVGTCGNGIGLQTFSNNYNKHLLEISILLRDSYDRWCMIHVSHSKTIMLKIKCLSKNIIILTALSQ